MSKRSLYPVLALQLISIITPLCMAACSSAALPSSQTGTVVVSGPSTDRLATTAQFSAVVSGSTNQTVTWEVNGVSGGSSSTGTITTAGLYTAPAAMPSGDNVSITALSEASSTATKTVSLGLQNPLPNISSGTAVQVANTTNTFLVDLKGTGFVPTSVISVGSGLTTTYVSSTELQATVPVGLSVTSLSATVTNANPGGSTSGIYTVQIKSKTTTATAAARLLDQATFGPTLADIQHVESIGIDAYLNEQFSATPSLIPSFDPNNLPTYCVGGASCTQGPWWQNVVTGSDQLRQRVAFALSEMFVTSALVNGQDQPAMPQYVNVLVNDAFAHFQQTMNDVTVSPEMGLYLNALNSAKPQAGEIANENFARENMQLFTMGLDLLNPDGSVQLDGSGNPIPAYTEAQVQAFARVFTGWTWAAANGTASTVFPNNTPNYSSPMLAVESQHDTASKTLLNGEVLSAGRTAEQDLSDAINNIFQHQNVGPFVCTQLIQHLVESDPSPAYVSRVSAVFAKDQNGIRGNMKAVIQAILEDDEARAGDTNPNINAGHLREPSLFLAAMIRGLGFTNTSSVNNWTTLTGASIPLSENPWSASSVFNFFPPDYVIPGANLTAPEFGIENTASVVLRLGLSNQILSNGFTNFTVDLSSTSTLGQIAANPANLVDYLGMLFMHSQMPTAMRTLIINTITPITNNNALRVTMAAYLVMTSSNYKIIQ
jgi:uncharacterized protein (DUF1800 family)